MKKVMCLFAASVATVAGACGSEAEVSDDSTGALRFAIDATPVTSTRDALAGVFIPPFQDCRESLDGRPGEGPEGQVCTQVSIAGATEEGRRYADYADCDVVRTQRPFWAAPPAGEPDAADPRLDDAQYAGELTWVTEQLQASACTCCHDSETIGGPAAQWDIAADGVWLDTLSDSGLALFAGLADSRVFGAFAPQDNNGFARELTGVPSTDAQRMRAFMLQELAHRDISEAEAREVPPFGGPIYANSVAVPEACEPGQGVAPDGRVLWGGASARYVYILEQGSDNPGVPPNLDRPAGSLWRLDVPPDQPALSSGVFYGTTPTGTLQSIPERAEAQPLELGTTYQLNVQLDVGISIVNCTFAFGDTVEPVEGPSANADTDNAGVSTPGATELGTPCSAANDACGPGADYCAISPGQTEGYCTPTGCAQDGGPCPQGWSCLDLSAFAPGQPSICTEQ